MQSPGEPNKTIPRDTTGSLRASARESTGISRERYLNAILPARVGRGKLLE
jgi:hypothetical protein